MEKDSTHPDIGKHITKAFESEEEVYEKFRQEFPKLRDKLRGEFRQILSTENPKLSI